MMNRDASGKPVHLGRVHKRMCEPFGFTSALPAWLVADSGTATFETTGSTQGQLKLTTAATVDALASLKTLNVLEISKFTEVAITAQGLLLSSDTKVEPSLRLDVADGSSVGVAITQNTTSDTTASLRIQNPGGNIFTSTNYVWRGLGMGFQRRNLTLRWKVMTGEVFIEEDGEVMGYVKSTSLVTTGQVTPRLRIKTKEAVAHSVWCQQFILETWSD